MSEITIENTYVETDSEWKRGCGLSEYNGVISISNANEGKDDKKYMQWVYPDTKDGAGPKRIPNQVRLGDLNQAKETLKQYLNLLEGGEGGSGDDVPF